MQDSSGIRTLSELSSHSGYSKPVWRQQLCLGDLLMVRTRNSLYSIGVLGNDRFSVSGGWFDHNDLAPIEIAIAGCTHGGRAIRPDLIAARGVFLEFGNRVLTTRIQEVELVRAADDRYTN